MYSRAETSKIRTDFWIAFGQYMKPVPNAQGRRINWPNYRTGIKDIYFRMRAERDFASIGIELGHADEEMQELFFDQFLQLKKLLLASVGEEWNWKLHAKNEMGQTVSKIELILPGVNVMERDDWPKIIGFLKPRIIALDEFWDNVKPGFED
ncbi:DUF4268 domain-containing protein [Algoriphagus sp. H41]|uniref:DUF4268 domain-containing protein n=1 Tax=Algoriphagus oliviformis TaxID=2811231 RepID=A0ABS3C5X5_9BACT|nr:DUF4268 domain-containing protein [Algoriphagus oliviformis]MBN7812496.1 DUF4268 domain-containing protein [Algoriphagus oliviformis]